jgi:hemin uptake protein HemP
MPSGAAVLTTEVLFGGRDEIILLHNGSPYRLRITRQNKLILTK